MTVPQVRPGPSDQSDPRVLLGQLRLLVLLDQLRLLVPLGLSVPPAR